MEYQCLYCDNRTGFEILKEELTDHNSYQVWCPKCGACGPKMMDAEASQIVWEKHNGKKDTRPVKPRANAGVQKLRGSNRRKLR